MNLIRPRLWSPTQGRGELIDPDGRVIWSEDWVDNALADEGEEQILNVWLREQTNTNKYLALLNDSGIVETDTMATMVETKTPGTDGYNRVQIAAGDWGAPALDSGDMQSAAAEKALGPAVTNAWTLTHVALVTAATGTAGKFLLYIPTAAGTVNVGITFKYTLRAKLQ